MGFNTVAVLFNDQTDQIEKSGPIGARIARAMKMWFNRDRDPMATWFGSGQVISQEHADYTQIVIAGQNTGKRLCDCGPDDLDWLAREQLADALRKCGWTVKQPSRRKKAAIEPAV